jgi:hypothetical protein
MADGYGALAVFWAAALLLFARAAAKHDEMAGYVAHALAAFASLVGLGLAWQGDLKALMVAWVLVFVANLGFLVRRIRHS